MVSPDDLGGLVARAEDVPLACVQRLVVDKPYDLILAAEVQVTRQRTSDLPGAHDERALSDGPPEGFERNHLVVGRLRAIALAYHHGSADEDCAPDADGRGAVPPMGKAGGTGSEGGCGE